MTDTATAGGDLEGGGSIATADLISFLNELLEAERAGAKVALQSAAEASDPAIVALLKNIQHDEAYWCGMLFRHIKLLGGEPALRVGPFHGKAMAIRDLKERIVFLNRGQGWVVRKLREMTPRVRDEALHADLAHMLSSHVANITLANSAIA